MWLIDTLYDVCRGIPIGERPVILQNWQRTLQDKKPITRRGIVDASLVQKARPVRDGSLFRSEVDVLKVLQSVDEVIKRDYSAIYRRTGLKVTTQDLDKLIARATSAATVEPTMTAAGVAGLNSRLRVTDGGCAAPPRPQCDLPASRDGGGPLPVVVGVVRGAQSSTAVVQQVMGARPEPEVEPEVEPEPDEAEPQFEMDNNEEGPQATTSATKEARVAERLRKQLIRNTAYRDAKKRELDQMQPSERKEAERKAKEDKKEANSKRNKSNGGDRSDEYKKRGREGRDSEYSRRKRPSANGA